MARRWSLSNPREGLRWLDAALAAAGEDAALADRALAHAERAYMLQELESDLDDRADAERGLVLARAAGDPDLEVRALLAFAAAVDHAGDRARAHRLCEEALTRARGAGIERLLPNVHLVLAKFVPGDGTEQAAAAIDAARRFGNPRMECLTLTNLAYGALLRGFCEAAEALAELAAPLVSPRWPRLEVAVSGNLGLALLFRGRTEAAAVAFARALELASERAIPPIAAEALAGLAAVAAPNDPERCALLLGAAEAIGPFADPPLDAELDRRFFAPAREELTAARWDAARQAGARLLPGDALKLI